MTYISIRVRGANVYVQCKFPFTAPPGSHFGMFLLEEGPPIVPPSELDHHAAFFASCRSARSLQQAVRALPAGNLLARIASLPNNPLPQLLAGLEVRHVLLRHVHCLAGGGRRSHPIALPN